MIPSKNSITTPHSCVSGESPAALTRNLRIVLMSKPFSPVALDLLRYVNLVCLARHLNQQELTSSMNTAFTQNIQHLWANCVQWSEYFLSNDALNIDKTKDLRRSAIKWFQVQCSAQDNPSCPGTLVRLKTTDVAVVKLTMKELFNMPSIKRLDLLMNCITAHSCALCVLCTEQRL